MFSGQAATVDLLEDARRSGHDFTTLTKPVHPTDMLRRISECFAPSGDISLHKIRPTPRGIPSLNRQHVFAFVFALALVFAFVFALAFVFVFALAFASASALSLPLPLLSFLHCNIFTRETLLLTK